MNLIYLIQKICQSFEVCSLAVAAGLAFGPVAQGGDEDSDIGGCEHSHDHGIDDDDNESEATMSDADDDDDNEAMEGDEDDEGGVEAYLTSLLFLLLAASGGELP